METAYWLAIGVVASAVGMHHLGAAANSRVIFYKPRSRAAIVSLVLLVVVGFLVPARPVEAEPLPDRMTAIGDSITQATDVCCWYGDHPGSSWSAGGRSWDGVRSHYERIRAVNPGIKGNNHNVARAGARMAQAASQAAGAVEHQADYVTILMGANDACTSSTETMTPVEDFRAQFAAAIEILRSELPDAHVFVGSIPNIYRLWQIYKDSSVARFVWRTARICQSTLASSNTEVDRQAVLARVRHFNDALARSVGCIRAAASTTTRSSTIRSSGM